MLFFILCLTLGEGEGATLQRRDCLDTPTGQFRLGRSTGSAPSPPLSSPARTVRRSGRALFSFPPLFGSHSAALW